MTKRNTRRSRRSTSEKNASRISFGELSDRSKDAFALRIDCPSHEEADFVRRSPRFAANKCKTPEEEESESRLEPLHASSRSELRRSRRLNSAPASAPAPNLMLSRNLVSKKRCLSLSDVGGDEWAGMAANFGQHGLILRRSPWLSGFKFSCTNLQLLPLPETAPGSGKFSKNCLAEKISSSPPLKSSDSIVSPQVSFSASTTVRCLRSRTVKIPSDNEEGRTDKHLSSPRKKSCDDATAKTSKFMGTASQVAEYQINANKNTRTGKKGKPSLCCFIGNPLPEDVARQRWQWRYDLKHKNNGRRSKLNEDEEDEIILNVDCHYAQAKVGSWILNIGDCVCVKGEETKQHIGRILEFFKTMEGEDYFRVQWFFRAEDTVLKDAASSHDKRRLFYSTLTNDNLLGCIISKVEVVKLPPSLQLKPKLVHPAAYYYDMEYCVDYSTFRTFFEENIVESHQLLLNAEHSVSPPLKVLPRYGESLESSKQELWLLDLYSGCGGMSTGLCIGAKVSGINLVTKWAVDQNSSACNSLRMNHPETQVRNESAEDFLELIKQWKKLSEQQYITDVENESEGLQKAEHHPTKSEPNKPTDEYEVLRLVDICYGDPCNNGSRSLHFQVRWKGYSPSEDTWEPIKNLSNCREKIKDFVRKGVETKLLPLPGEVDVICGGPPCQGISGYNRFRNVESPLDDERNRQIVVFMDVVDFLKPKYVLMENVVDIIKLDRASLARYALSRLVGMKYQSRLGTLASGCYGLPQFRLRVFIWGAHPTATTTLPKFPLPTHDAAVVKYWPPVEFGRNVVAYEEGQLRELEKAVILSDSISDLPPVTNFEKRERMRYGKPPESEFQSYIRLSQGRIMGKKVVVDDDDDEEMSDDVLCDHRPLQLSEHDFLRIRSIPRRKGANFRDLPGIVVGPDNVARRDPGMEPVMLPTGRPMVPDCLLKYDEGRSKTPYRRLWWDETVSTVLTMPSIVRQAMLHPEQDRILSIRECARLQGFPDFYKFSGTIKERYQQIGNAVSVPVARALGYALAVAHRTGIVIGDDDDHLLVLPHNFSYQLPQC